MTLDDLKSKGLFDPASWPEDLILPGEENVSKLSSNGGIDTYQFAINSDGVDYGMRVNVDTATCPEPEWGVVHMLGQISWYWKSDKTKITANADGSYNIIDF